MVFTYFPVIYPIFPFLGAIKGVLLAGVFFIVSYYFTRHEYMNYTVYQNPILKAWIGFLGFMVLGLITSRDRGLTFYTMVGDWFPWFLLSGLCVLCILSFLPWFKRKME